MSAHIKFYKSGGLIGLALGLGIAARILQDTDTVTEFPARYFYTMPIFLEPHSHCAQPHGYVAALFAHFMRSEATSE